MSTKCSLKTKAVKQAASDVLTPDFEGTSHTIVKAPEHTHISIVTEGRKPQSQPEEPVTPGHYLW